MTTSKTWVNKALFNILHVLLKPETRKVISQTSLNTNDGIKLWEVIITYALDDTETNRALAIERFQQFEIPMYDLLSSIRSYYLKLKAITNSGILNYQMLL